ncbi:MAG: DUF2254 domain-containing protein [Pseudomonadota bacterium]
MRAFLLRNANAIRASYWFIPSLMFTGAVALSFVTLWIDAIWGAEWMNTLKIFELTDVESARSVLGVIAQSMIGVAGVTFSITLVAVTNASSQFGPRLVGNFMRDRGNQITLGTFISTFIYALMVLRSVSASTEEQIAFVPHISVLLAIGFAVLSVGVLIYFIHHVPASIDIGTITSSVGRALRGRLDETFPRAGGPGEAPANLSAHRFDGARRVLSDETGYLQTVQDDVLIAIAEEEGLLIRLQFRPGDFVMAGETLLHAAAAEEREDVDTALGLSREADLRACFAIGDDKTADQNLLFLVEELVEIAIRALSPGVNDPFTAMTCLDWLTSALAEMAAQERPSPYRTDAGGTVRLIAHSVDFERLLDEALPRLLPYVARDAMTATHLLRRLAIICSAIESEARRATARTHMDALIIAAGEALSPVPVRTRFLAEADKAQTLLDDPKAARDLTFAQSWYGGSA